LIFHQASIGSLYDIALNMRDRDYQECSALSFTNNRPDLADEIARSWSRSETSIVCGTKELGGIAAFTYIPQRNGVWNVGLFATDKFDKIQLSLTKLIIKRIIPSLSKAGAHRIEAQSIAGYDSVHNWLKFLGFEEESTLRSFGCNGEDFINFSYVRNVQTEKSSFKWQGRGVLV
jgi:hypothetical protein|tara:strand:+ start:19 stop:543 length:525 start_codon:yes stop_codon:yes gene_type:complete